MGERIDFVPTGRGRCDGDQAIVRLPMSAADQSLMEPAREVDCEMAETMLSLCRLREIIGDDPRMQITEAKARALVELHTRYSRVISKTFLAEVVAGGSTRSFDRMVERLGCPAVRGNPGRIPDARVSQVRMLWRLVMGADMELLRRVSPFLEAVTDHPGLIRQLEELRVQIERFRIEDGERSG